MPIHNVIAHRPEQIAKEDPAVTSGLLEAEVRPWLRAMTADPSPG